MVLAPDGSVLVVFNVLLAVAMVVAVLPSCVSFLLEKFANYNEGANCNAAGVAVLLEKSPLAWPPLGISPMPRANGSWRGGPPCRRDLFPRGRRLFICRGILRGFGNLHGVGLSSAWRPCQSCRSGVVGNRCLQPTEVATEDESPAKERKTAPWRFLRKRA